MYFGEYFELDAYLLEVLNELISKDVSTRDKARYFRAAHIYSAKASEGKLSTDELEKIKDEFLVAVNLPRPIDSAVYEFLYYVSFDLKNWGDAANYYFLNQLHDDEHYSTEIDNKVLEAIIKSQKSIERLFSTIDQILNETSYFTNRFAERCLPQLFNFFIQKKNSIL